MSAEEIRELMNSSWRLTPVQRVATLSRAVEMADAEGDLDLAFNARNRLVSASYYVPGSLELLTAFSWLLARHDEDPERFRLHLWSYKWVVNALPAETAISLEQIENVMADLETRFTALGQSDAPALKLRLIIALATRELDRAEELLNEWRAALEARRSNLNDCRACDEATHVRALTIIGQPEQALREAQGHIDGTSRCSTQPHFTLPRLIEPAREFGPKGLASDIRRTGYRLVRDDAKFYSLISMFVRDSLRMGNIDRALDLIAKHRGWRESSSQEDSSLFSFSSGARETLLRCRHLGRDLPSSLADIGGNGRSADQVADELITQAEDLAARFDKRNGNTWHSDRLASDAAFATR